MMRVNHEQTALGHPTKYRTAENCYPVSCGVCRELYFVDEHILLRVYAALTGDPANIPFSCEDCELEFAEAGYL